MFQLRDYQLETINRITNSMRQGNKRIIVQQPPRTGKTVIMAEIARRTTAKGNNVLFIIHRKEVLDQARQTFGLQGVDPNYLQMGMVQSLNRHIDQINKPQLILIDEAHHSLAKSYRKIIDAFPNAYIFYFTATPIRTGHDQMDQIADDLIPGKTIEWLQDHHFLARFKYFGPTGIDDSKLKRQSGEYTAESIDQAMNKKIYGEIVDQYLKLAKGKQAVVYCHSIESAKRVMDQFRSREITTAEVDGETNPETRDRIVQAFRDQQIMILVNVNLFTEGVDLPNVDCVIMARPTCSLALYLQFSMRCLNPREGKTAIIIDHVGNFKRFSLPNAKHDWQEAIITKDKRKSKGDGIDIPPIVQCSYCFGTFYRKDMVDQHCPLCGQELTTKQKDFVVVNEDLQEIKENEAVKKRRQMVEAILNSEVSSNVQHKELYELKTLKEFQAYSKAHGYKPGWAYYRWKNRRNG